MTRFIRSLPNRQFLWQLLRYGSVGLITNFIGFLLYLLLTQLGVPYRIAMSLLYFAAVFISFFGNRYWVFNIKGHSGHFVFRYVIAHSCGYILNFAILTAFAVKLGYPHQYVQAAAIIIVAGFLFILFRLFVFRNPAQIIGKPQ